MIDSSLNLTKNKLKVTFLVVSFITWIQSPLAQDAGALEREFQRQLERQAPTLPTAPPKSQVIQENQDDEKKVFINGYNLFGNSLLSNDQIQFVIKRWVNREVSFNDLSKMTLAVQDLYSKQGRIALAYIPPQNISDGIIRMEIIEGKMGEITVDALDPSKKNRFDLREAKPYFEIESDGSQFIDTMKIERSLILLNELPGVIAEGEFLQGKRSGESDYLVRISDGPLFTGNVAISNNDSYSTGVAQTFLNMSLNDISGIGDQVALDVVQSWGSTFGRLEYSRPIGTDGLKVGIRGNYLNYQTLDSWNVSQTSGTSNTLGLNASYALERNYRESKTLYFVLENHQYNNLSSGIQISDYQIINLSAGFNGSYIESANTSISYNITSEIGNLKINDVSQQISDDNGPKTAGNFIKLSVNASRSQNLEFLPKTTWLVMANGQIANKNLNSSEQLYLGGPYAVRAYPVTQGGGSQGLILTNELQYRLNNQLQVGVFGDVGYIQQFISTYPSWQGLTNAGNNYNLYAVGLTTKYVWDKLTVNGVLAIRLGDNPLYNSYGQQLNGDGSYRNIQGWIRLAYLL
jgi:hemolysin activation/secretion protein